MPTGTGKTLVAVLAIDHFRSHGKVVFIVPTRPLVTQQAEYVRKNAARSVSVMELQGAKTDHLSAQDWREIVQSNDVLVGTAEVFRRALVDTKYLDLIAFSLFIFDECHNVTGNSPMAAIMRDSVHRCAVGAPRILGLTASFVHGSLTNIEKKRQDLEGLLQARIFCPDVEERPMEFERVSYEVTILPEMEAAVQSKVQSVLTLAKNGGLPLKETQAVVRRGTHVFTELGLASFLYFLRECVLPQVQAQLEQLAEVQQRAASARQAMASLPGLRQSLREAADRLSRDGSLAALPGTTDKAERLVELLQQVLSERQQRPRVIVFCEQTVLAHPLAHVLQERLGCPAGACTGVGSMTDGQRNQALRNFRSGEVPLMTCTAALEEGLDVSECEVVVRFSAFKTTKSHIQGAGRARAWKARVFYFDNDPGKERAGQQLMEETAKCDALSLSAPELQQRRAHTDVAGVHPYHSASGAEISIFNCVQLVYEYAARVLGQTFRPEESMLSYVEEVVCDVPRQYRKKLVSVTVPSPDGFFEVGIDAVDARWGALDLPDVAEKSRIRNWDATDKELRRFVFVVAIELSKRGLLDANNQPTAHALRETKHACKAWTMSPGVRIGVRYDSRGVATAGGGMEEQGAAQAETAVPPTTPGSVRCSEEEAQGIQENFKGRLNELTCGQATYTTVAEGTGFRSTVSLPDGRQVPAAASATTKKAAEQLAAKQAIAALASPAAPRAAANTVDENYKGRLNELTRGRFSCVTEAVPGGFLASVTLPDGRRAQAAAPVATKRQAEQMAAKAALAASESWPKCSRRTS